MKLILVSTFLASALALTTGEGEVSSISKHGKFHGKLGNGRHGGFRKNLSPELEQAFDNCLLNTCLPAYKSPDCQTCWTDCHQNFQGPKRFKCLMGAENGCFETCKTDDENNWDFFLCKKRCKKAAKNEVDPLDALEAVQAEVDVEEFAADLGEKKLARMSRKFNRRQKKRARRVNGILKKNRKSFGLLDQQKVNACMASNCLSKFLTADCAECKSQCFEEGLTEKVFDFEKARGCMVENQCTKQHCKVAGGKKMKREFKQCKRACFREGSLDETEE